MKQDHYMRHLTLQPTRLMGGRAHVPPQEEGTWSPGCGDQAKRLKKLVGLIRVAG